MRDSSKDLIQSLSTEAYWGGMNFLKGSVGLNKAYKKEAPSIICSETLTSEEIWKYFNKGVRGFIVATFSPLSHALNALISINSSSNQRLSFVLGVGAYYKYILESDNCTIDLKNNCIITDKIIIKLRPINISYDNSIVAFKQLNGKIWYCRKPFYYYHSLLSPLVARGLEDAAVEFFNLKTITKIDSFGRIWLDNFPQSKDIFQLIKENPNWYINICLDYLNLLDQIVAFIESHSCRQSEHHKLKEFIIAHYKFSRVTASPVVHITDWFENEISRFKIHNQEDRIYPVIQSVNQFMWGESAAPTFNDIFKTKARLNFIILNLESKILTQENCISTLSIDQGNYRVFHSWRCFVSGLMVSELRRHVVNLLKSNCHYSMSIFIHR